MLISDQIPAMYNGVSQQPATLRSPTQCEEQINGWATIVDGLQKRAPSEYVGRLTDALPDSSFIHEINRDVTERYVVVVTSGNIRVFDLAGNPQTVINSDPEYLTCPPGVSVKSNFSMSTVADYTFVVNKSVTVELEAVGADQSPQSLDAFSLVRGSKVQYPPNPPVYNGGAYSTVQSFEKLPATSTQGALYEIRGTDQSNFTTYFVRRDGAVWDETVRPGLQNLLKTRTMPHALVRRSDGTFEFGPFSWAPRRVGDDSTNPHPTFVGRQIRDVFFYKNRLGLCCDENVVLSRAGDFGTYHRMTVLDLLADDVIDIAASDTKVTKINFAVPFATSLMLFADQVQFRMSHTGVVSGSTLSLDVATRYEMSTTAKPEALGSDVYFTSEKGDWSVAREYFVRDDTALTDASNLTAHVPRYLPAGVSRIIPANDHNSLFFLTDKHPNRIYVYKFYWQDEQTKAQSSWCYWEMQPSDQILSGTVLDNHLYLVIGRPDGAFLERIPLDSGVMAGALPFQVYLDRRVALSGTYLPVEDKTYFVLPYDVEIAERDKFRVVLGEGNPGNTGRLLGTDTYEWEPTGTDKRTFKVRGQYDAGQALCGMAYTFRYTFNEVFMKNSQQVPITTGHLQLRTVTVYYTDTAFFRTEVSPYGITPEIETVVPSKLADFTGKTIGDAALTLGSPSFHEGSYSFQIYGNSDVARVSLTNDSHLACNFQSAEWEGFYQNRSRFR